MERNGENIDIDHEFHLVFEQMFWIVICRLLVYNIMVIIILMIGGYIKYEIKGWCE